MIPVLRALACALTIAVAGCASLPGDVQRPVTTAFADTADTPLGRRIAPLAAEHPGLTGVVPLQSGREAFAVRVLLSQAAVRSIDAQYYIWHDDTTGGLLAQELRAAAERGVRVRLLLDDQNTKGLDALISVLDAHPNIEVRLFNPFANRALRLADFTGDFSRVNRRMHNKSFTVDNQFSVVGGRNIGDEYFGANNADAQYADLDALVTGAIVPDVSREFDAYWNSPSAYPAPSLIAPAEAADIERERAAWATLADIPGAAKYLDAVRATPLVGQILAGTVDFQWAPARLVADDPSKVLHPPDRKDLHMAAHLYEALGRPESELDLVSPYFVPTAEGTQALRSLADRGVKVRVLTNSLAATDVAPVYAGYAKYREPLLRGGNVLLYEMKRSPPEESEAADRARRGIGSSGNEGLHAKTFGVDRRRIFVGSFNLDPRSARLNTEMGVVLDCPPLAEMLARAFDERIARDQYEVRLTDDGEGVYWIERTETGETRYDVSPDTSVWKRMGAGFLSILPIEWLL
jgi:putative cardiolipin synthase